MAGIKSIRRFGLINSGINDSSYSCGNATDLSHRCRSGNVSTWSGVIRRWIQHQKISEIRCAMDIIPTLGIYRFLRGPTARFKVLIVFLILAHHRRRIVHFNSLARDRPESRLVQSSALGNIIEFPEIWWFTSPLWTDGGVIMMSDTDMSFREGQPY